MQLLCKMQLIHETLMHKSRATHTERDRERERERGIIRERVDDNVAYA